jgi:hypothetical protein
MEVDNFKLISRYQNEITLHSDDRSRIPSRVRYEDLEYRLIDIQKKTIENFIVEERIAILVYECVLYPNQKLLIDFGIAFEHSPR